jgi:endonuclease YncB( thermonuclease family)
MVKGGLQGKKPEKTSPATDSSELSSWQRATDGARRRGASLWLRLRQATGIDAEDFNPEVDEEPPGFREKAKRVWEQSVSRAKSIAASALLWTRRIAATVYLTAAVGTVALIVFAVYWLNRPDPGPDLAVRTTLVCDDCEPLTVVEVIDGDTLRTSLGTVRMYGADAPEAGEPCYLEAIDAARRLTGTSVRAQPGPRERDPFERRLFYLYTESGRSIEEVLIRNGLAVARAQDGQHRDLLLHLEREAAVADRGCLWG